MSGGLAIIFKGGWKGFCINDHYRFHGSKLRTHGLPGVGAVGFGVGAAGKETFAKTRVNFVRVDKNDK